MEIQKLYIYPIKSCLPIAVAEAAITECGLQYDRQYVLVDLPEGEAGELDVLTIKTRSELCLFQPTIDGENLVVRNTHAPETSLTVPLDPSPESLAAAQRYPITLFSTSTVGIDMGDEAAAYFSAQLNVPTARLCYIGRPRDPHPMLTPSVDGDGKSKHPMKIRFMDVAPMLLSTTASIDEVTSRLPGSRFTAAGPFDVTKFRPNIHVAVPEGTPAYDEEFWAEISVGEEKLRFDCTFNTARCLSVNVDYETGKQAAPEEQIYKKLMKDRRINPRFDFKPCFGRYCCCSAMGARIRVGDKITVQKRNAERHVDGTPRREIDANCTDV
ncbi:hypothetical protein FN846DRAFT_922072 [Sphaerosporella brunnea]|uniref:MOSC domain-containing protein n=1 Tax=Sphaerosporella brunnea TaxID=1250544 RepID=A0A5J5EK54_9PEZI|nr:hypothetical protein FN846DRAFT_922072 [Sphaerosporella brunnea]